MKILAMDTSAKVASVSLVSDEKVLSEFNINMNFTHSQTLMPMCEDMLKNCKVTLEDIDYFAVSNGPGSFTGLRIGISAIKGIAYALNKPCVEVSVLDALSVNVKDFDGIICAVMDARRLQVYNALYKASNDSLTKLKDDRAVSIDDLYLDLKDFNEPIILVGDGADLCYESLKPKLLNLRLASVQNRYQRASSVAMAAIEKIKVKKTVSAKELMPYYLRLPQAQRELMNKNKTK